MNLGAAFDRCWEISPLVLEDWPHELLIPDHPKAKVRALLSALNDWCPPAYEILKYDGAWNGDIPLNPAEMELLSQHVVYTLETLAPDGWVFAWSETIPGVRGFYPQQGRTKP